MLRQIGEKEPQPKSQADFVRIWRAQPGESTRFSLHEFFFESAPVQLRVTFPLAIGPTLGNLPASLGEAAAAAPVRRSTSGADGPIIEGRAEAALPRFDLEAAATDVTALETAPAASSAPARREEVAAAAPKRHAGRAAVVPILRMPAAAARLPFELEAVANGGAFAMGSAPSRSHEPAVAAPGSDAPSATDTPIVQSVSDATPPAFGLEAVAGEGTFQMASAPARSDALAAEAAERLTASVAAGPMAQAAVAATRPRFEFEAIADDGACKMASATAGQDAPAAEAAERLTASVVTGPMAQAAAAAIPPRFELECVQEPVAGAAAEGTPVPTGTPVYAPVLCGICLPGPAIEPAVCRVEHFSQAAENPPCGGMVLPALPGIGAAGARPALPAETNFAPSPEAQPVEIRVRRAEQCEPIESRCEMLLPAALEQAAQTTVAPLAQLAGIGEAAPEERTAAPEIDVEWMPLAGGAALCGPGAPQLPAMDGGPGDIDAPHLGMAEAAAFDPAPVESMPRAEFAAIAWVPRIERRMPEFCLDIRTAAGTAVAKLRQPTPVPVPPRPAEAAEVSIHPVSTILCAGPRYAMNGVLETEVPRAGMAQLEFYCQRSASVPAVNLAWRKPSLPVAPPRFLLRAIPETFQEKIVVELPRKKKSSVADVFRLPESRRQGPSWLRQVAKPLAACFLLGGFLWMGSTAMRVGTRTAAVNRDASTLIESDGGASAMVSGQSNGTSSSGETRPVPQPRGVLAEVRQAIASRAAAQITESFQKGMSAWGEGHKPMPAGWTRHPDGYVLPGPMALFRPSLDYRNYKMEFFGQIEHKGMSWAVRARDPKNYYAMKVSVVEPGLRPIIAVEHYPVVGGKKGHQVVVPLPELMFHDQTPYRVAVAIDGDRVTTSIEGQEVDSWTDDTLRKGGVGFFADAGERARIYWMKIFKNDDFLGRVCAYLSGSTGEVSDSATLWPDGTPGQGQPSGPGQPAPRAAVALATIIDFRALGPARRSPAWNF